MDNDIAYWQERLQKIDPLVLPRISESGDFVPVNGTLSFTIENQQGSRLINTASILSVAPQSLLLSFLVGIIYRYHNQPTICSACYLPKANGKASSVPAFIFCNLSDSLNQAELVSSVEISIHEASRHTEIPLESLTILDDLKKPGQINSLLQIVFFYKEHDEAKATEESHLANQFGICFSISRHLDSFHVTITYNGLYSPVFITNMAGHYQNLMSAMLEDETKQLGNVDLLSAAEKNELLVDFNSTAKKRFSSSVITDEFRKVAFRFHEKDVVVFENQVINFQLLNERTDQLANYLLAKGLSKGMLVAVSIERSPEMLIAMIAVMKAGGVFVPIDPAYPVKRIVFIFQDSGAGMLLCDAASRNRFDLHEQVKVFCIDDNMNEILLSPLSAPNVTIDPDDLAYTIYTSGSTGTPKGVQISHQSLTNLIYSVAEKIGWTTESSLLAITSISFDISYLELFMPLIVGGKVIIASRETASDSLKLKRNIARHQPSFMQATPATWQMLFDDGWRNEEGLKMLCGGEAINEDLKNSLLDAGESRLWNMYGPTETTIWSTMKELKKNERVTIGKPLSNTGIYILDRNKMLLPKGFVGELCISGAGLAKGYWNREELTKEKFCENPYSSLHSKIYRTGDLARWLDNGDLECLGRLDNQVKVHGFRIELGEIESALHHVQGLSRICVVSNALASGKSLAVYYVADTTYLKERHRMNREQQVKDWQNVYEDQYAENSQKSEDQEFDTNIWNDSFTNQKIPQEHIREWLTDITTVLKIDKCDSVFEMGCGTGLVYFSIAKDIKKYFGSDFSKSCINQINAVIEKKANQYPPTQLYVCAADELNLSGEDLDVVLLNSVIQYFPDEEYLSSAIQKGIESLSGKGRFIIGDVRDYRLLIAFRSRMTYDRLPDEASLEDFESALQQAILKDEQLCVSPEYFYNLRTKFPEITHVEIRLKDCQLINEMSLYRFNVIMHVGDERKPVRPDWITWDEIENLSTPDQLLTLPLVAIEDVPNPKLFMEGSLAELLKDKRLSSLGQMKEYIAKKEDKNSERLGLLLASAHNHGYQWRYLINDDPYKMNIVFSKTTDINLLIENTYHPGLAGVGFTNIPFEQQVYNDLQKEMRDRLSEMLPEYMVPKMYIPLLTMPLTDNGKTDRVRLSKSGIRNQATRNLITHFADDTVKKLLHIWKTVLMTEKIDVQDDFFSIGGHSLSAVRVISAIRNEFGKDISVVEMFNRPTIGEMAKYLNGIKNEGNPLTIIPGKKKEKIPLSFFQESVLHLDKNSGSTSLHIPFTIRFNGSLDKNALEYSFNEIVNRHEVLRSVVIEDEKGVFQAPLPPNEWHLSFESFNGNENELMHYLRYLVSIPFNIYRDHLLRAKLIALSASDHIVIFVFHPLVADGWSVSILMHELEMFYNAKVEGHKPELPELTVQYGDFALWQRDYLTGPVLEQKSSFWKKILKDLSPLALPYDFAAPAYEQRKGAWTYFAIDAATWRRIEAAASSANVTPYMFLLTIYSILLSQHSTQNSVCIGSHIANRLQQEVEPLIGYFANTLPLHFRIQRDANFKDSLQNVKRKLIEVYEHQELPLDVINNLVRPDRKWRREQLFQVTFEFNNMPEIPNQLNLKDLVPDVNEITSETMEADFRFSLTAISGVCYGGIKYCTNIFIEQTMRGVIENFQQMLAMVLDNPGITIKELLVKNMAMETAS